MMIMAMDIAMTLISVPLTLQFTNSAVRNQFIPGYMFIWLTSGLVAHLLFRWGGLYATIWRFASTQDFVNIIKSCVVLTIGLYAYASIHRQFSPFVGLNEREFLVFFLLEFALISGPRLAYRYLRDGDLWARAGRIRAGETVRSALFVGRVEDADVALRLTMSRGFDSPEIIGIVTIGDDENGKILKGVPMLGDVCDFSKIVAQLADSLILPRQLIMAPRAEHDIPDFIGVVRTARSNGMTVRQLRGLSPLSDMAHPLLAEVDMETLLRRRTISLPREKLMPVCKGFRVLVTGGAGSIGSELALRVLDLGAAKVLVLDRAEPAIHALFQRLPPEYRDRFEARIVDICRPEFVRPVMRAFRPDTIFHAAALKHVPLLEIDWAPAIDVNVFGTLACAELALEVGASQFILISSDKAAEPESILGLTKRMAEHIVGELHERTAVLPNATRFHSVRFGNVFASNGSVATIFSEQIKNGGPVTVTDPAMTRYFMNIGEAVDLVLLAAAEAANGRLQTSVYMLDMGEPIRIVEMAEKMIQLAGKIPYEDIAIRFTNARPGDKLHESLVSDGETVIDIGVKGVYALLTPTHTETEIATTLTVLKRAIVRDDRELAISTMRASWRSANLASNVVGLFPSRTAPGDSPRG